MKILKQVLVLIVLIMVILIEFMYSLRMLSAEQFTISILHAIVSGVVVLLVFDKGEEQ